MPEMVRLLAKIGPLHFRIAHRPPRAGRRRSCCPETSTTRRCEKLITARMMCSIRMMVTPCSLRRNSSARISSTSECERPAIASSAINSFGSAAMARASSSLRISTWVRSRGKCRALSSSPTSRSRSMQRASIVACGTAGAARRHRVEQRNAQIVEEAQADERPRQLEAAGEPHARALVRGRPSTARPSKRTEPCSFCSVPQMQLTSVLLPEPFGPIRPRRSPAGTLSEMFSSATKPPKRLPRSSTSSRFGHAAVGHGTDPGASVSTRRRPTKSSGLRCQ